MIGTWDMPSKFQRNEWRENNRVGDTMTVEPDGEFWIVAPQDGRPKMTTCWCCGLPFETRRAAQLIADATYPLPT
jgi:hypothetical protein